MYLVQASPKLQGTWQSRPPAKWEVSVWKKASQCHEMLQYKPKHFKKEWQGPVLAFIRTSIDLGQLNTAMAQAERHLMGRTGRVRRT